MPAEPDGMSTTASTPGPARPPSVGSTPPVTATDISFVTRLTALRERIEQATAAAGRPAGSVRLLAVGKTFPAGAIRQLASAGQIDFGENYWQETAGKLAALADLAALRWHFIGPVQSNKTRPIAEGVDWVHTVEREKIATRLSEQREAWRSAGTDRRPLAVLIQVNVSGEASKSGCQPAEARALAERMATLPGLVLRGLMAIPEPTTDTARQRTAFAAVRQLHERIRADLDLPAFDTLSMGMSADLEAAIAEGATLVRVGTALFGERHYGEQPAPATSA